MGGAAEMIAFGHNEGLVGLDASFVCFRSLSAEEQF